MRGQLQLFDRFDGGLNSKDAPYSVEPNQARDLLNVVSTARGAVRKRAGSTSFAALDLDGLFACPAPAVMVGSGGGKLYKITGAGVTSEIKAGLSVSARWDFVVAPANGGQGPIYGMNGSDPPQQWDGVAAATSNWTAEVGGGTVPNGRFCLVAANRVWVAGVGADPSAVFFSELGNPRNWPAANVVRFDPGDGGPITALGRVGPYILVFKEDKAWVIYNLDTGANRPLGEGVGCIGHRSLAETPQGTFFLGRDGVYRTDGSAVRKASEPVRPTLEQASAAGLVNAAAAYFDDHYYLSFARSSGDPDRTLDLDLAGGSWWLHTLACSQWATFDTGTRPELFGAGPTAVLRCFVDGERRDSGALFAGYWASSFHHFKTPALRKRVRQVHFDGSGFIEFSIARDFATVEETLRSLDSEAADGFFGVADGLSLFGVADGTIYGGLSTVAEARAFSLGVARAWSVRFGNAVDRGFEIDSYSMALTPRRS